ncbi:DSS1/SEM1 family-domain-containing protein [Gautieria morchelliformis]|nr:DSS1/SEM1 family-domain-containing protein [Gautieria morchelliformis]
MSASASASKSADTSKVDQPAPSEPQQAQQSQLGALEEDDEFEEFPAQDWDDSETNLAHLNGSGAAVATDKLWEDNWDDDDIEDEFSLQLRSELAKAGKNPAGGGVSGSSDAMQH